MGYVHSMRLASGALFVSIGCGNASVPQQAASSAAAPSSATATDTTTADVDAAKAGVLEADAPTLRALGGTYRCDQRIHPAPPSPHISAWEWSFPDEPSALADKLSRVLPGATREGALFRYLRNGEVEVTVSVESAERSRLSCGEIPAGARSLVVASRR
jgi:hypothetical protein